MLGSARAGDLDFAATLRLVGGHLAAAGHRFALVGGHGLAAYGLARATLDLDLVVDARAQDGLVAFMEESGFETLHRSRGHSNHLHPEPDRGRVDFVYVRGETARRLFDAAHPQPGPGGEDVLVPKPEHLIAMKLQAMVNDPERAQQELADIRFLMALDGVDREEVEEYFRRHDLEGRLEEIS